MVGERDRRAEAGAAEAGRARHQRRARLQLLPRPRRLLGRARPARRVAARADAGGLGHLSRARDVPGVGLRLAARVAFVRGRAAATGPTSACPASTATASRSRSSTRASTSGTRTFTARCCPGIDVLDRDSDASARANPVDRSQIEQHGTELAGILVGAERPRRPARHRAGGDDPADPRRRLAGGRRRPRARVRPERPADRRARPCRRSERRRRRARRRPRRARRRHGAVRSVHRRAGSAGRAGCARPEHARRHAGGERRRRRSGVRVGRRSGRRSGSARGRGDRRARRRSRRCGSSFVAGST